MRILYTLIALICLPFVGTAQSYWQQRVDYTISVKLDDRSHELRAQESFVYTNNSPQTLDFIYIHLWPNAYRNGNTALGKQLYNAGEQLLTFGNDSIKGGIDSLDFTVNGQKAVYELDPKNPDIAKLFLPQPLKSGEQMTVATPYKVKIPSGEISRLGHVGQSYQITQWYVKPAVFDKNGWNQIPYLNQGEFYSEFGTFDVSITLPKNYIVGATGDLQTASEIAFMDELAKKTAANIDSYKDKANRKNDFQASSSEFKTIRFIQKNVHDFAWFADKRYLVLKGEVELPETKRKVTTWALFTPKNATLWKNAIEYINDGTFYYSKWNGEYPYNQVTAVDGTISAGGGMEYPNVTVIGNASSAMELEIVIVHEVGHNWFYGILGSNERVHGWMDEGMNTLNELRYVYTKYPNNKQLSEMVLNGAFHFNDLSHYDLADFSFRLIAGLGEDQPIETHSADFTSANYGAVMYMKTGLVFNYLKEYLGETVFDKAMHDYYDQWHFKHPQPEDMKAALEKSTGKDLSWLFGDLIQTTNHIDYKITKVKSTETTTQVTVKNVGQVNGPIEVTGFKNGKKVKTEWVEPSADKTVLTWDLGVDQVVINASGRIPELNQANNAWRKEGVFGKAEKTTVEFLIGDHEIGKNNVFWAPAIGGNIYDKFMLGAVVHNNGIPMKKFQYLIAPMYSFGAERVVGIADLGYTFLPKRTLKLSRFGLAVRSFKNAKTPDGIDRNSYFYASASPFWLAKLGNRRKASPVSQTVLVQGMYRFDKYVVSEFEHVGGFIKYDYNLDQPDLIVNFGLRTDYISNVKNGQKMWRSTAELTYKYRYMKNKKDRWAEIRLFGGNTWESDFDGYPGTFDYTMSLSGASGIQDLFVEDYYFGRTEGTGMWAQQRQENMGGFKSTSGYGTTIGWLASTNVFVQTPIGPKFIGFFADAGLFENSLNGNTMSAVNAGIGLRFSKVLAVYFPLYMSQDLSDSFFDAKYGQKIRFTLHLNLTNKPLNLSSIF